MASLFALGVMSLGWMAFIAALIATEKLLPWKEVANRGIAILLLALGLMVAFAPEDVPGLTMPDSAAAMSGMEDMGGMSGEDEMQGMQGAGAMDHGAMKGEEGMGGGKPMDADQMGGGSGAMP
jgi:hypothetical protein